MREGGFAIPSSTPPLGPDIGYRTDISVALVLWYTSVGGATS